jgi:hypothetical protein
MGTRRPARLDLVAHGRGWIRWPAAASGSGGRRRGRLAAQEGGDNGEEVGGGRRRCVEKRIEWGNFLGLSLILSVDEKYRAKFPVWRRDGKFRRELAGRVHLMAGGL